MPLWRVPEQRARGTCSRYRCWAVLGAEPDEVRSLVILGGGVKDGPNPLCTSHDGHACYLRRVDRTGGRSGIEYSRREGFLCIPVGLAPDAMSGMCSPEGPRRIEGYAAKTRERISNTSVTQHSMIGTDASYLETAGYGGQAGGELG